MELLNFTAPLHAKDPMSQEDSEFDAIYSSKVGGDSDSANVLVDRVQEDVSTTAPSDDAILVKMFNATAKATHVSQASLGRGLSNLTISQEKLEWRSATNSTSVWHSI